MVILPMNSSVIIVAAGNGTRFKGEIPKQYVKINNETILNMTLKKFINLDQIRYIQPVINLKHENIYNETIEKLKSLKNFKKILPACFGGNERCISVKNGLVAISKLKDNPNKYSVYSVDEVHIDCKNKTILASPALNQYSSDQISSVINNLNQINIRVPFLKSKIE